MLRSKSFKILPLVLLLLAGTACTNDALDDGGSADVVLEVESLENPAVTASLDATTGFCTFTVNTWKFGARALPKNPSPRGRTSTTSASSRSRSTTRGSAAP